MNGIHLMSLLQRFMDGTTTVGEETALADFFRRATDADRPAGISADDWKVYRQMFAMFDAGLDSVAGTGVRQPASWRVRLWRWKGRVAAAAAVALLVVGGLTLLPRHSGGGEPALAKTVAENVSGSPRDSVSAEQPRRVSADSVEVKERPKPLRKSARPYWQPRPPKVYVAEAAKEQDGGRDGALDNRQIDEAVRQAEVRLKAINLQQAAELKQLELQAMECFSGGDDDAGDDNAQ